MLNSLASASAGHCQKSRLSRAVQRQKWRLVTSPVIDLPDGCLLDTCTDLHAPLQPVINQAMASARYSHAPLRSSHGEDHLLSHSKWVLLLMLSAATASSSCGAGGGGGEAATPLLAASGPLLAALSSSSGNPSAASRAADAPRGSPGGMQVAYEVRASAHGMGIFAAVDIAAGELIWSFGDANVAVYSEAEAEAFVSRASVATLAAVLNNAYWVPGSSNGSPPCMTDPSSDDGRYFNHSSLPGGRNVALGSVLAATADGGKAGQAIMVPEMFDARSTYALRDIAIGEELCDDYNSYVQEPDWYVELLASNGVDTSYMQ